jgi:hypothetical protein
MILQIYSIKPHGKSGKNLANLVFGTQCAKEMVSHI